MLLFSNSTFLLAVLVVLLLLLSVLMLLYMLNYASAVDVDCVADAINVADCVGANVNGNDA